MDEPRSAAWDVVAVGPLALRSGLTFPAAATAATTADVADGGALNVIRAVRAFDRPALLMAETGCDTAGREVRRQVLNNDAPAVVIENERRSTPLVRIASDCNGALSVTITGDSAPVSPALERELAGVLCSYFWLPYTEGWGPVLEQRPEDARVVADLGAGDWLADVNRTKACLLDVASKAWAVVMNGESLTRREVVDLVRTGVRVGAELVVCSLGAKGIAYSLQDGGRREHVRFSSAIGAPQRSGPGTGDAFIGGVLAALVIGFTPTNALRVGQAAAATFLRLGFVDASRAMRIAGVEGPGTRPRVEAST